MAVSDRHFAAQVRDGEGVLYKFDDLGCAVLWLDDQSWKAHPRVEIWVNDYVSGAWLDARTASYATGQQTPMDYGLGAQAMAEEGSIDFVEAEKRIRVKRRQRRGGAGAGAL